jgi:SAM-dependent methyltransferase
LYARQPSSLWSQNGEKISERKDFEAIRNILASSPVRLEHVLDIGCFTGALLVYLKTHCEVLRGATLHGIEPSEDAAGVAKAAGIYIAGRTVADLSAETPKYDLILMTDVFEHIINCSKVIEGLLVALKPNGRIVIVTGAFDSRPFSFWKNNYYYAAMPEHLAFITKRHAEWLARENGLRLVKYTFIENRSRRRRTSMVKALGKSIAYLVLNLIPTNLFSGEKPKAIHKIRTMRGYGVPNIFSVADHVLVVLEASASPQAISNSAPVLSANESVRYKANVIARK